MYVDLPPGKVGITFLMWAKKWRRKDARDASVSGTADKARLMLETGPFRIQADYERGSPIMVRLFKNNKQTNQRTVESTAPKKLAWNQSLDHVMKKVRSAISSLYKVAKEASECTEYAKIAETGTSSSSGVSAPTAQKQSYSQSQAS